MLNIVTGKNEEPQALLIRGIDTVKGPGKVSRILKIDRSFNAENLGNSPRIWLSGNDQKFEYIQKPRIGIDYAGKIWKNKPWRFILKE